MPATIVRFAVLSLVAFGISAAARADDKEKLAKEAYGVFDRRCAMCHHQDRNGNDDYDVLSWTALTSVKPSEEILKKYKGATAYIKPSKPDESLILLRVTDKSMPKGKTALSADDRETLARWIKAGAGKEGFGK
jgi:cytochrome c553